MKAKCSQSRTDKYLFFFLLILFSLSSGVSAQPSLDDFLRESDYKTAVISPDGRYLAEIWNKHTTGERILTVRDLHEKDWPLVGSFSGRVMRPYAVNWANSERLLVHILVPYRTKSVIKDSETKPDFDINDYYMFSRTVVMNPDTSDNLMLLEDQRKVLNNRSLSSIKHFLPEDPEHILMTAYRKERLTLFKVNIYTGKSEIIETGTRKTRHFVSNRAGDIRYRIDYFRLAKKIKLYEKQEDKWTRIEEIDLERDDEDESDEGEFVGLYNGQDLVYRKKNPDTGYKELWKFNNDKKEMELFISEPGKDVLYPILSARDYDIIGYALDGDVVRSKYFSDKLQDKYDQVANKFPDYNIRFQSYTEDGNKQIIKIHGSDSPGLYYLYDFKNQKMDFLQHAYMGIATTKLSIPATVSYQARDGLTIPAYLLLPNDYEAGKNYPLVILPHGGPQSRTRASYDDFAQFISTRGYIVMMPNFRGSIGYGKEFEEAGYKEWGGKMQDDLEDAVHFMIKKGMASADKVCIAGISYGGYAALMGTVKTPSLYKCAISINGVTDLPEMNAYDKKHFDSDALIDKFIYQRVGHPEKDEQMLVAHSPARQADKIQTPILLIAGTEDDIVPYSQAKKMLKVLKKGKKKYTFIKLKETGHDPFYYREDMETVYKAVDDFLKTYLK